MRGVCISAFTRSVAFSLFPSWVIFIPARLALLALGEGKEKKAVVKLLWQLGGISDLLLGRFLDFNSCFLMAGNERIYEGLRDARYSSGMHVLLI